MRNFLAFRRLSKSTLGRLDPRNSLFGRIFVWFWLAVVIMLVAVFSVGRYLGQTWQVSALSDSQLVSAQRLFESVENLSQRGVDLPRALRRVSARGRWHIMAIRNIDNDIVFGFPPPMLNQRKRFFELAKSESPVLARTTNMEMAGPFVLSADNTQYSVFVGRLLPREQRPLFIIGSALFIILLLGTLACLAIAWTIAQPIRRLSELSNRFASGDEQAPDAVLIKRKDELGQLHHDIYEMASNLAKSLHQQKLLMANISHELRTPLTRLQLSIAMLAPQDGEQTKYAQRIEKEVKVMDELIGQALQLAKTQDNQNAFLQKAESDLALVLENVRKDLVFEAQASKISINSSTFPELILNMNANSLQSALENVTRNAIKYAKTTVQLSCCINRAEHSVTITIDDDGEGLAADVPDNEYDHIFDPFYRSTASQLPINASDKSKGTGLGLAIAKAAIELHNGTISAKRSKLGGLQISLSMPIG